MGAGVGPRRSMPFSQFNPLTLYRVGIDGHRLAGPHGGDAAYAHTVAEVLSLAGHEVMGIFGLDVGSRPELREVLFFDRFRRVDRPTGWGALGRHAQALRPRSAIELHDVPLTARVEKRALARHLPPFGRIVSGAGLFETAATRFRLLQRLTSIRIDHPPDIMHWTAPVPLWLEGACNIYSLPDRASFESPWVAACIRHADYVCAVSSSNRDEILARFAAVAGKIGVAHRVPLLPADVVQGDPATDARMIEGAFGLKRRGYLLGAGTDRFLHSLAGACHVANSDMPLVMIGASRGMVDHDEGVRWLEPLPRHLLLALMRGARAIVSESEGRVAHEAMLLGTPVLRGVGESSAEGPCPVEAGDTRMIARWLQRLGQDDSLCAELTRQGAGRAAKFSAGRYHDQLMAIYDKAMGVS